MNNDSVTVQLEKEKPENLTCIRSSEKYKIQWLKVIKVIIRINGRGQNCFYPCFDLKSIQNGVQYSGNVYSSANSSALQLQGSVDETGTYTCKWNNSLGEVRYKHFTATYVDKTEPISPATIAISVSVALAILLLISVSIGVRFYLFKVS